MSALRSSRNPHPTWKHSAVLKILRRPVVYYSCLALLAGTTVLALNARGDTSPETEQKTLVNTPVARRLIRPGEALDEEAVLWEKRPANLVPTGVAAELSSSDAAAVTIYPGEEVLDARVRGRGGLSSRMPSGSAALSIPKSADVPPVQMGDRVRLLAGDPRGGSGEEEAVYAVNVAWEAWVVAADSESITVAMHPLEAAAAVTPKLAGTLTLAALASDIP